MTGNKNLPRLFLIIGSMNAGAAVTMGAFGAHSLKAKITENMLSVFQTAVQYHFYHSLGLLIVGLLAIYLKSEKYLKIAGLVMFMGIVLFSGSLYILSISGIRWLGFITPFGGIAFIISWVYIAVAVWKWSSSHHH